MYDITTGENTEGTGFEMLSRALNEITNENRFGKDAKKASKKGLAKRWGTSQTQRKQSYEEAYKIW